MIKPRSKVYIDGANIFYTQKNIGWSIDWVKMKRYLKNSYNILEIRYYTGIKKNDFKMAKYLNYFDHIGIATVTKSLKRIKTNQGYIYKSNFDVEMTVDILLDRTEVDVLILFSGDSDFHYLVKRLKDLGKLVIIVSSRRMLSWELKLIAHKYIFIEDIKEKVQKATKNLRR